MAGGRVGMAMARRGALWGRLGEEGRFGTPDRALVLLAVVGCVYAVTGTFEVLLEVTTVGMLSLGALTVVSLFVIRRRDGEEAPYRATGYPVAPLVYVLVSVAVVGATVVRPIMEGGMTVETGLPLVGLGILVAAFVGHGVFRRVRRRS
jgi:basic amino acid/polyamine antiporter, APA family